jgi:hypothetical protein
MTMNRKAKKLDKILKELKGVDIPKRFKKEDNDIYGYINGAWKKIEPDEVIRLKNAFKKANEAQLKKNDEPLDIDVIILDEDEEVAKPLINFNDNYELHEDGFHYVINVEPPTI